MKGVLRYYHIQGLNLERFLRQATEQGIQLYSVRRAGRQLHMAVDESREQDVQALAESGGWGIQRGRRSQTGRILDWICRRKYMLVAVVCFTIGLFIMTKLVLSVVVTGGGVYRPDLVQYLDELGISIPGWKSSIRLDQLKEDLEWRYPTSARIECGWRGTKLVIRFVSGNDVYESGRMASTGDVIASRDGIVDSVVVLAGTAMVSVGDIVRQGDVLIRGEERAAGETMQPVQAQGVVMARVWDEAAVQTPLAQTEYQYTGRQYEAWRIACPFFDWWSIPVNLYDHSLTSMQLQPLGGIFFPVKIYKLTVYETEPVRKIRSLEEARREAGEAANRKLREETDFHDDFVDKWVDYSMIEDEVLWANAVGERVIDIARHSPHP